MFSRLSFPLCSNYKCLCSLIGLLVLTVCGPTRVVVKLLLVLNGFVVSTIALYTIQREHSTLNLRDMAEQRKVKVTPFPLRKRCAIKECGGHEGERPSVGNLLLE